MASPSTQDLLISAERQSRQNLHLERLALRAVLADLRARLRDLQRAVPTQAELDEGDVGTAILVGIALLSSLTGLNFSSLLRPFLVRALLLGRRHADEQLGERPEPDPLDVPDVELPPELEDALAGVQAAFQQQLGRTRVLLESAQTPDDIDLALGSAARIESRVEAGVTTAVHQAVNEGTSQRAEELEARRVWLAERDACLHCLAYAGQQPRRDGTFPQDLTFADRPLKPWQTPLRAPPRHPHCRCQIVAWNGVDSGGAGLNFPESLQREARRSVIKGWALPSESDSARQRAAQRLLLAGAGLPATVEARARAAIRSGRFRTRPAP